MTIIVKTVTKLTLGFILLYGIYITLTGHLSPGGGFAGGVIIALSFTHVMLAFGKETALKRLRPAGMRIAIGIAALVFLVMAIVVPQRRFLNSEVVVPLCEAVIVGAGLFAIFVALVLLTKADKDAE